MELLTTSELRKKEIINLCDGARLGYASDFEFDRACAQVTALIVEAGGFLGIGKSDRLVIPWGRIECIGEDTVLVRLTPEDGCKSGKRKLFECR